MEGQGGTHQGYQSRDTSKQVLKTFLKGQNVSGKEKQTGQHGFKLALLPFCPVVSLVSGGGFPDKAPFYSWLQRILGWKLNIFSLHLPVHM